MNTIGELLEAKGVIVMTTERRTQAAKLRSEVCADLKRILDEPDDFCLDIEIFEPLPSLAMERARKFHINTTFRAIDGTVDVIKSIKERLQR